MKVGGRMEVIDRFECEDDEGKTYIVLMYHRYVEARGHGGTSMAPAGYGFQGTSIFPSS